MATTSIPKTMKGVWLTETGGPEVLKYRTDLPVPEPQAGEALVQVSFAGVNFIDTYFRTGLYPSPKPEILGREAEGIVVALGSTGEKAHGLAVGDRVAWIGTSTYAEFNVTPADRVVKIPDSVPAGHGAAVLLQGLTALTFVREAYAVKKGDWILVHAAAGGVGLLLCQILRALGARTIGTASTPEKVDLAKKAGANYMINYSHEDIVKRVKEITDGAGVHAVFDGVGQSTFEADLEVLARKGSLVSFGNASGAVPPFAISRLSAKNLKVVRPTLYNYITTDEEFAHYTRELVEMLVQKQLDTRIHEIYPLQDVARAHQDLEGRKTTGKLLLKP